MHPIVERMMAADTMSQWLGIEVLRVRPRVPMQPRGARRHGQRVWNRPWRHHLCPRRQHPRFAVNARTCRQRHQHLQHLAPVMLGDTLHAEAILRAEGGRIVHVDVEVQNQEGTRGVAHRHWIQKSTSWT